MPLLFVEMGDQRFFLTMSGLSRAFSRIRLRTEVYPRPRDFAFLSAWGESRSVTVCFRRPFRFSAEIPQI